MYINQQFLLFPMKHNVKITLLLVALFLVTQIVGLGIVNNYIDKPATLETGNVTFKALPYSIERPEIEEGEYKWY